MSTFQKIPSPDNLSLELLHEMIINNRNHCDHSKNNLGMSIENHARRMGDLEKSVALMNQTVSRLDTVSQKLEESSVAMLQNMSENRSKHELNGSNIEDIKKTINRILYICTTIGCSVVGYYILNKH